jgi:hypothetical protein
MERTHAYLKERQRGHRFATIHLHSRWQRGKADSVISKIEHGVNISQEGVTQNAESCWYECLFGAESRSVLTEGIIHGHATDTHVRASGLRAKAQSVGRNVECSTANVHGHSHVSVTGD